VEEEKRKMIRMRRKRRGRRRKQKRGQIIPVKILFNNIRGFNSKKESLDNILNDRDIDVACLNETNVHGKSKINIKNYFSFTKNNPNKKSMGGIATSVKNDIKQSAVRVNENSEGDEYLIVRLEHVEPPLNILNIYGQQEGRDGQVGKERVVESWGKILKELCLIQMRGEAVLIVGDLNRAVGADEFGVKDNKEKISYGGHLVRELVKDGEYFILNNLELAVGGPWTRVDPADGGLSCLDLAIGSTNILPFVKGFSVDSERNFTPKRGTYKDGKFAWTYTDHYPFEVELVMPSSKMENKTECRWNLLKPGGWEKYKEVSDDFASKMDVIIENKSLNIEDVMMKVDKIMDKIKYSAFGKTKIKKYRRTYSMITMMPRD
jgi:hypothetical protein